MRLNPRRNATPFWKQDVAALLAIAMYLALAYGAVRAWGFLSDQANAFTSIVQHVR